MMLNVDVIVNVVNEFLLGGGGVDGVIYRVVGLDLLEECCILGGCLIGEVKLIKGYCLLVKYVIYIVGLVWWGGVVNEDVLFVFCYWCLFEIFRDVCVVLIVFFVILMGVYGFLVDWVVIIVV